MRSETVVATLLGVLVFLLSMILWSLTGRPGAVPLNRFMRGMPIRLGTLALTTACLAAPIAAIPRILSFASKRARGGLIGRLVRTETNRPVEVKRLDMCLLRPLQGVALSLILTDRLHQLAELSGETEYLRLLTRLVLPLVGNMLVSLLLSTIWTLDDLGLRFYFERTGEVRTAGSNVGVILPVITGIISVASLYWNRTMAEAVTGIAGIVLSSYPAYAFFTAIHHEFMRRRTLKLLSQLSVAKIETNVL
jgi:hypothetical protein